MIDAPEYDNITFVCHRCAYETDDTYTVSVINEVSGKCPECKVEATVDDFIDPKDMDAVATRAAQFADIDRLIAKLKAERDRIFESTKTLGPDDWSYTGRGGDLAHMQHVLASLMGELG